MGLLESIGASLVVEAGTETAKRGGERAAALAGEVEKELNVVDGPAPAPLWSSIDAPMAEALRLDHEQAATVNAMLRQRDSEFTRLLEQLRDMAPSSFVVPFWFVAGDAAVRRQLPMLPQGGGSWKLDSITSWTDPGGAGDATLTITITGLLQIPMRVTALRANPGSVKIGLPIAGVGDGDILIQPAIGGGGAVTDRIGMLFVYTRNV